MHFSIIFSVAPLTLINLLNTWAKAASGEISWLKIYRRENCKLQSGKLWHCIVINCKIMSAGSQETICSFSWAKILQKIFPQINFIFRLYHKLKIYCALAFALNGTAVENKQRPTLHMALVVTFQCGVGVELINLSPVIVYPCHFLAAM